MHKLLAKTFSIVAAGFVNVFDKGGRPYVEHCIHVMSQMDTDEERILALLHDAVEDGITTIEELWEQGYPDDILNDLKLLTHNKKEDYLMTYIPKISTSKRATKVKLADLRHNSDITRIKGLTKKDFDRLQIYHTSYIYLSKI